MILSHNTNGAWIVEDNGIFVYTDGTAYGFDFDKWYLKEAKKIFQDELDRIYNEFKYNIPYPSLTIRKMKTRWGVCNYKTNRVTLNFNLIKKDIRYLDYVIVHELSHLLYHDHSKSFWNCVEVNMPDYKDIRKDLKKYE